jgi:hypothetical protein
MFTQVTRPEQLLIHRATVAVFCRRFFKIRWLHWYYPASRLIATTGGGAGRWRTMAGLPAWFRRPSRQAVLCILCVLCGKISGRSAPVRRTFVYFAYFAVKIPHFDISGFEFSPSVSTRRARARRGRSVVKNQPFSCVSCISWLIIRIPHSVLPTFLQGSACIRFWIVLHCFQTVADGRSDLKSS